MTTLSRILFFTSSHKMGLTGQATEQAIAFSCLNQGVFLFLSGENEQFPGLFKKLESYKVPFDTIHGLDEHKNFFRLVRAFYRLVKQFRPDFVTVQTNWQLAIAVLARFQHVENYAIVYIINGYRHNYRFRSVIARLLIGLALFFFSDYVVAPSGFLKKKFSFLRSKLKTIFIGEGDALFKEHPLPLFKEDIHIIFGGMFRTGKNQDMLIRLIRKYIDKSGNDKIRLYLPGDGPLLDNCKDLVDNLGLVENVIFPGLIHRDKMLDLYLDCQYAIAPTNVETFGHCIVEPFVLGRVLFTRHIGVADDIIQHGKSGFFFEGEDDLLDLLIKVSSDHHLCRQIAENARRAGTVFKWENICKQYHIMIYDALAPSS